MKKYFIQKKPFIVPTTDGKIIEEHHGLQVYIDEDRRDVHSHLVHMTKI